MNVLCLKLPSINFNLDLNYVFTKSVLNAFKKLAEIQKNLKSTDDEYLNVSIIEGKGHENAWNRMECYNKEYKKEYELCEKIMKY